MPNENIRQSPTTIDKAIIGLLFTSLIAATSAGLGVWKQSALIEQRITSIDNKHLKAISELDKKYTERSGRVIDRINILTSSLATHLSDDNAHQLMIQREHLIFEGFMNKLNTAHTDIESLKHQCDMYSKMCCDSDFE